MHELTTDKPSFNLGTWVGRMQALRLVASRCTVADIECLTEISENKLYRSMGMTWEQFCIECLGISRQWAETLIRRLKQLGPDFFKLNNFTRIKPADYRMISNAVTGEGLAFGGEIIPVDAEHVAELAQAIEALREDNAPETDSVDPRDRAFIKAEKSLQSALAAFERLQAMDLDEDGRLKLVVALDAGREHLDRIRLSTPL